MNRDEQIDKMIEDELKAFGKSLQEIEDKKENTVDLASLNAKVQEHIESSEKMIGADVELSQKDADDVHIEWVSADEENKPKRSFKKRLIDGVIRCAVMLVALVAFGYASYELTLIYVESAEGEAIKSDTADMFLVDPEDLMEHYEPSTDENGDSMSFENQGDGQIFVYDHKKMLKYNSDAKGYIRQGDGTYIDNPILQAGDNDYYLTHLANHRKSSIGAIFIDSVITEGLNAKNCIIHGHNIGDRAGRIMFGSLNWYLNKTGYYKENPTFDIWIEDTRYRYYVFATYRTDAEGSWVYRYAFDTDEEFMDYVNKCIKSSRYKYSGAPEITTDSHIITLSTCTYTESKRMIVQLVRGEELDVYGNPVVYEEESERNNEDE